MNKIEILEPRWHDRVALVADWKIGQDNQIVIKHKEFPEPFYAKGQELKKYPIKMIPNRKGVNMPMREVPLSELSTDLKLEEL